MAAMTPSDHARAFSLEGYADLVRAFLAAGYRFVGFDSEPAPKTVIMRHDIDFDLAQAARMADIERQLGVTATYFFLLRTEMYNLFSSSGTDHVRAIIAGGHEAGLHFDARAYADISAPSMRAAVHAEMEAIARWFGVDARYLSFHRPAPALLEDTEGKLTAPYRHAYQSVYSRERMYMSDSQGGWRYGHPLDSDAFKSGAPMQILIHPVWWEGAQSPHATLEGFVAARGERIALETARHCKVYRTGRFSGITD